MPRTYSQRATIAYKQQTGLGVRASGAGQILRTSGGDGGRFRMSAVERNALRRDGMREIGRGATRSTSGTWAGELSIGAYEDIIEAILLDTWGLADLQRTSTHFGTLTTGAHQIIFGSGNPAAMGFSLGQCIRAFGLPDPANNGRNLRITGLLADRITVADTLIANATATSAGILTVPGRVVTRTSSPHQARYFTIEEFEDDITSAEIIPDFCWSRLRLELAPNGFITCTAEGLGTGSFDFATASPMPLLSGAYMPLGQPIPITEATIRLGDQDLVEVTAFDITLENGATAVSSAYGTNTSPDVLFGKIAVSMNITALRKDLEFAADFAAETLYSLSILAEDAFSNPLGFFSIYVPEFSLGGIDKSALEKGGGARVQTISIPSNLVGSSPGASANAIMFQSTAIPLVTPEEPPPQYGIFTLDDVILGRLDAGNRLT